MHGTFSEPKLKLEKNNELASALRTCRSAFALCGLFSLFINLLMLASPIYMLQVYDRVLTTGHVDTLIMITLIVTVAFAVMCALDALRTALTIRIGCWLSERLGPVFLGCAIRGRLKGDPSGVQTLQDIGQIQGFVGTQGMNAFFDFPWVPLFIGLIWMLHPLLGFVAILSAVVLLLLSLANEFTTRKANETANKAQIEALQLADTTIRNAEVVHSMGMLQAMTSRWMSLNTVVAQELRRGGEVGGVVVATTKFVRFFVQAAILGLGAWLVLRSQLTAGGMIAASILLARALAPVEMAMGAWRNFMNARFAYKRLKTAIKDYPEPPMKTQLPAPTGHLSVDGVSFVAPNTNAHILDKVSFSVSPGEALAIIGPSGAGKSTLCRLLVGLTLPNAGEVRLDGSQVHHWDSAQIGQYVGFLQQDVELFSGTVRENIARKRHADDEDVLQAAMLAHAHEMIQDFPQGYDTDIGGRGVRLSGGQRQRIGLARAVFGSPRLIILDEPNANLDQAGEVALSDALSNLKAGGAALIIVGHRQSTLAQADKILLLKDGCVAMYGPRDEVLAALRSSPPAKSQTPATIGGAAPVTRTFPRVAKFQDKSTGSAFKPPGAVVRKEAAQPAAASRGNIFDAVRDGHMPVRKCGRRTLVFLHDLRTWLDGLAPSHANE